MLGNIRAQDLNPQSCRLSKKSERPTAKVRLSLFSNMGPLGQNFCSENSKAPIIIAATLQWLKTRQAQNRHIEITIIIAGSKTWKANRHLGNWTHDLALHLATLLALFFSGIFQRPGVVAEWWSVCTGTPGSSCRLSSGLGWTRRTTCATFTQTAVSYGSDYSIAQPVPATSHSFLLLLNQLQKTTSFFSMILCVI